MPMLDAVLRALAARDDCHVLFPANAIVGHYVTLKSALDAKALGSLLSAAMEFGGLEQELTQGQLNRRNAGLFRAGIQLRRTEALTKKLLKA